MRGGTARPGGRGSGTARALRAAQDGERGSGTVFVLVLMMLLVFTAGGAALIGAAVGVRHQAETAADLAALSGASALVRGLSPCPAAARVAHANGASLAACRVTGGLVDVSVAVRLGGPLTRLRPARAAARAGPASGGSR